MSQILPYETRSTVPFVLMTDSPRLQACWRPWRKSLPPCRKFRGSSVVTWAYATFSFWCARRVQSTFLQSLISQTFFPAAVSVQVAMPVQQHPPDELNPPYPAVLGGCVWTPRLTQAFFRSAGCMRSGAVVSPASHCGTSHAAGPHGAGFVKLTGFTPKSR